MMNANELDRIVEEAVSVSMQSNGELFRLNGKLARLNTKLVQMNKKLVQTNTKLVQTNTRLDFILAIAKPRSVESVENVPVVGQQSLGQLSQDPEESVPEARYSNVLTLMQKFPRQLWRHMDPTLVQKFPQQLWRHMDPRHQFPPLGWQSLSVEARARRLRLKHLLVPVE